MNSQEVNVSTHKHTGWRAARYLVMAFALGGLATGTVLAQPPNNNRSSKTATSQAANSPASSSANQSNTAGLPTMPTGVDSGNYHFQGSLTFGWRYSNITGSQQNYDTFVNMQEGPRLLNFSLNAHSLNQNGSLFDTMEVSGFGFGGDPVDVVRLNMTKNKWYDFSGTYRRYKYYWNYNLLANPLNPSSSNPAVPITSAIHLMDLSHRITNLQLKLLPQSAIHFRLGYTHSGEAGPSFMTDGAGVDPLSETGATTLLYQNFKNTQDNYDAGVDFNVFPRTTLSYDEYVQHYSEDTYANDGNLNYVLPDGTPVDMGLVFNTPSSPCADPVTNPNTTPPTATDGVCQGDVVANHATRPRATIATEKFGFQTTYFRNLNMTGLFSYSSGIENIVKPINYNNWIGVNTRTTSMGSSDVGTTSSKRIIVNGDWNAVYDVTSKFRIMDSFNYNTYRTPGLFNFNIINYYPRAGGYSLAGAATIAQNPSQYVFDPTTCPAPYTAADCPQHNTSSAGSDMATGYRNFYLQQELRENTFELSYDFTPKIGAHVGYRYTKRMIYDAAQLFYNAEVFAPGGSFSETLTNPNDSNQEQTVTFENAAAAARGDCAIPFSYDPSAPPGTTFVINTVPVNELPEGCTYDNSTGLITFSGMNADSDTSHGLVGDIDSNSALMGLWVRPSSKLRTSFDLELFSANHAFTRITPRLLRHYQISSTYVPVSWADITGMIDIVDSSDNVTEVQNKNHDRSYALSTTFMPNSRISFDLSYNYSDVYTQALVCYSVGFGAPPTGAAACPIPGSPVPLGAIAAYQSKTNFASADLMVKPVKQLTFALGYSGSFARGTTSWYNPLSSYSVLSPNPTTPYGPLRYNYQTPYVKMNLTIHKGFSYTAVWNYYGYNSRGNNNPVGLAPLGTQDFNGNNMTMSAQYSF